ncbi:unnamed protein product [Rhizophagus irregularis]|nr:unnamed protein product [Rhizophagus irregularis]CAB5383849.1 unnamed protein product [Rhizophagus irregularis]
MLENIISEWIRCIDEYYRINSDGNPTFEVPNIDNQLINDIFGFVEANKALTKEEANLAQEKVNTSIKQSHPQAYYTSRKLTEMYFQEESQGFDCMIED